MGKSFEKLTVYNDFQKEAMNMSYILQTNHLTKIMDGKELVKNVNIHVKKGEIYGFLGPNGA